MPADFLCVDLVDGIATVAIDNPRKMNALTGALYAAIRGALQAISADPSARVVVLTGAGKAFSVGADLDSLKKSGHAGTTLGEETAELMRSVCGPLIEDMRSFPLPIVAAVNGVTAGAAVGVALAADVVIAARSAYFYLPFVPKLGILPDLGATWFLSRLLTRSRTNGLTLLGERLSAEQAANWGLIWSCVDDEAFPGEVRAMCERLAALPPGMALETRRAYDAAELHTLAAQLDYERQRQQSLLDSEAFAEGARAFLEKRQPKFR